MFKTFLFTYSIKLSKTSNFPEKLLSPESIKVSSVGSAILLFKTFWITPVPYIGANGVRPTCAWTTHDS